MCFEGVNVQLAREVGLNPSTAQLVDFGDRVLRIVEKNNPVASAAFGNIQ